MMVKSKSELLWADHMKGGDACAAENERTSVRATPPPAVESGAQASCNVANCTHPDCTPTPPQREEPTPREVRIHIEHAEGCAKFRASFWADDKRYKCSCDYERVLRLVEAASLVAAMDEAMKNCGDCQDRDGCEDHMIAWGERLVALDYALAALDGSEDGEG